MGLNTGWRPSGKQIIAVLSLLVAGVAANANVDSATTAKKAFEADYPEIEVSTPSAVPAIAAVTTATPAQSDPPTDAPTEATTTLAPLEGSLPTAPPTAEPVKPPTTTTTTTTSVALTPIVTVPATPVTAATTTTTTTSTTTTTMAVTTTATPLTMIPSVTVGLTPSSYAIASGRPGQKLFKDVVPTPHTWNADWLEADGSGTVTVTLFAGNAQSCAVNYPATFGFKDEADRRSNLTVDCAPAVTLDRVLIGVGSQTLRVGYGRPGTRLLARTDISTPGHTFGDLSIGADGVINATFNAGTAEWCETSYPATLAFEHSTTGLITRLEVDCSI